MPPGSDSVMDRLSLRPRVQEKVARIATGVGDIDARLEGGLLVAGLHEIRAPLARDIGAATGVLLGLLCQRPGPQGPILWVTDPAVTPDAGLLNPDGLAQYGVDPARLTLVQAVDLKTALWAADEGARCTELSAVVLHIKGNPARLDRVATRRLMLRAQSSGVTVILLRQSGAEEAGAAHTRWRVEPHPSPPDPVFPAGVGLPCASVTLERSRSGQQGSWPLVWNPKCKSFAHDRKSTTTKETGRAQAALPRLSASGHGPGGTDALGTVVALRRPPG